MGRVSFVDLGGVAHPAPAALPLLGEGAVHLRSNHVHKTLLGGSTSCRFWPQVAFARIVAWLARLNTDGKRPVDELNLKSSAGLAKKFFLYKSATIGLGSSQAGQEKGSSCHGGPGAGQFSTETREPVGESGRALLGRRPGTG